MKLYWWNQIPNFGDRLSPLLVEHFLRLPKQGPKSIWYEADPLQADLLCVGSILDRIDDRFPGTILGSGKLHDNIRPDVRNAKILGVRGPLTARSLLNISKKSRNFILGDPGLLANELVGYQKKEYDLGVLPHWSDDTLCHRAPWGEQSFQSKHDVLFIDPRDNPLTVLRQIGSCRKIVASSLHGIVLADAFGIPRRTEIAPRMMTHAHYEGAHFKFLDYAASVQTEYKIGVTQSPPRHVIEDLQYDLFDAFESLR